MIAANVPPGLKQVNHAHVIGAMLSQETAFAGKTSLVFAAACFFQTSQPLQAVHTMPSATTM